MTDQFVYKIKKPVNFGFLDFSICERRRHFSEEEVRLNRRLAPEVYLGVVPITSDLKFDGTGEPIEWAVKMRRLSEEATLLAMTESQQVTAVQVNDVANRIAEFHTRADHGPQISRYGRFDVVAANASENFEQSASQIGSTVSRSVFERVRSLTDEALALLRPLIDERAARDVPRDTHGDLHLDHVYLFPERKSPHDIVIIDCIEFNERFRYADPVADMAFLVMDLIFHGRRDLAAVFADTYFAGTRDVEGQSLLPFYTAYRAVVRAKVEGFELAEREIPEAERSAAQARARAHWLLALGELERPERRPCLILIGGLPGTGKSTFARALAEQAHAVLIRSDEIRKELADLPTTSSASALPNQGIYSAEWTDRTYAECLWRADTSLFEGHRIVVDATFSEEIHRQMFLAAAARLAVPALWLACEADRDVALSRLASRDGDASDADATVYAHVAQHWQGPSDATAPRMRMIDAGNTLEHTLAQAMLVLVHEKLV
ncbi:MAG: AAA family ATPase [Gemmataceae bacterium]